jgi:4'-phosphopantetheinyl transferase
MALTGVGRSTGWTPTRQIPPLEAASVHVWRLHIQPDADEASLARAPGPRGEWHLTANEHTRAARFFREADRQRFKQARHLLREILGHYLQRAPADLVFGEGTAGKPIILARSGEESGPAVEAPDRGDHNGHDDQDDHDRGDRIGFDDRIGFRDRIAFNVSHAGDWALLAFARDRDVGVDVEHHRELKDLEDLAARFFAPAETAALMALPSAQRQAAFFRIWTRKEAFVKAIGEGIGWGLDRFIVSHGDDGEMVSLQIPEDPKGAARWTLRALPMEQDYAAAVAFDGPPADILLWTPSGF